MTRFTIALVLCVSAGWAQQPSARIKIDTDRTVGEIHPHVFGNFAEHLGRCVYGGIYEEGSPLSDGQGYRKDVMQAVRDLGVSIVRWPGGNFVSGYHWKDGIGPKAERPVRPDHAWGAIESNRFGTDEFLQYCERTGIEPYLCINAGLGTIDEAREWVEYVNESRDTYWARQRRKNGRDKPYAVTYWGLGNEIDGPWQMGHKTAAEYATFALEAARAMRRADPSIKLIAVGSSNYNAGADWVGWNRTVLDKLKNEIDYLSLHMYVAPRREQPLEEFLSATRDLDERIEIVAGLIRAAKAGVPRARPIAIAFDEWNVCCRTATGNDRDVSKHGLEERYGFEDALAMGMFLNSFVRHADTIKMANLAQLVNALAPIYASPKGMFRQPIYFPIAEYGKQRGNQALDLLVKAPAVSGGMPALDVSASWDEKGRRVFVNVLNRSSSNDVTAAFDFAGTQPRAGGSFWQMTYPDLRATNDFDKEVVAPRTGQLPAAATLKYTFPRASLTILTLPL
jgi:alpha-N-arabinofuranosidase